MTRSEKGRGRNKHVFSECLDPRGNGERNMYALAFSLMFISDHINTNVFILIEYLWVLGMRGANRNVNRGNGKKYGKQSIRITGNNNNNMHASIVSIKMISGRDGMSKPNHWADI